jgi:hypothetical protein
MGSALEAAAAKITITLLHCPPWLPWELAFTHQQHLLLQELTTQVERRRGQEALTNTVLGLVSGHRRLETGFAAEGLRSARAQEVLEEAEREEEGGALMAGE